MTNAHNIPTYKNDDTWLFSVSSLSKIVPIILFLWFTLWNINNYFDWKKADDMALIGENFQKVSEYYLQASDDSQLSEEKIAEMEAQAEKILAENNDLYTEIVVAVEIIETQACPILKNSMNECLEFIGLYSDMVTAFSTDNYEDANAISSSLLDKSDIFITEIKKDNIDFQQMQ